MKLNELCYSGYWIVAPLLADAGDSSCIRQYDITELNNSTEKPSATSFMSILFRKQRQGVLKSSFTYQKKSD